MTVVQLYTMQSVDEARALADMGIDRLGVTPAARGLPGEVGIDLAAEIVAAVRDRVVTSAISVDPDSDAIVAMVEAVDPHVLHLCPPPGSMSARSVAELRSRLPSIELMQAIAVTGESAVAEAVEMAEVADMLLLDSETPEVEGIGAAGIVHDWEISRRIVETVDVPVILAGGLSADNVSEAIARVGPWGVDSLTHTNRPLPGGGFRKDLALCESFAAAARGAA